MAKKKAKVKAKEKESEMGKFAKTFKAKMRGEKTPETFTVEKALEVGGLIISINRVLKYAEDMLPMFLGHAELTGDFDELPKIHAALTKVRNTLKSI